MQLLKKYIYPDSNKIISFNYEGIGKSDQKKICINNLHFILILSENLKSKPVFSLVLSLL